jgi:lipoyl synthase
MFSIESGKGTGHHDVNLSCPPSEARGTDSEPIEAGVLYPVQKEWSLFGEAPPLEVIDWGCLDYREALRRQRVMVEDRMADRVPDRLILVEHPPVITVGRSGSAADLRVPREAIRRAGIEMFEVERGGQATYHGPGQLVVYPITKLRVKDLHRYLRSLLEITASVLRGYGLQPEIGAGRPGVWVKGAKIASVGLAARRWVIYHGLALNVNTELGGFNFIVPCGRPEERITSLQESLGRSVNLEEIRKKFVAEFVRALGYRRVGSQETTSPGRPNWLVRPNPDERAIDRMETRLARLRLATVCQSAHCPNLGVCFGQGTATFMILGRHCTRRCRFCAVDKGRPEPVDSEEPERVALAARDLGLRHVVVTSVTRDDLADGGAGHFAQTIETLRILCPEATIEVLVPDFQGSVRALGKVVAARPDVFNHNLETVARLYATVRPEAGYRRSLEVLRYAAGYSLTVKSGLMLGLGETPSEIRETLRDLKQSGCRLLTLGQYLAPSRNHLPVGHYLSPAEFDAWGSESLGLGFAAVAAGPLVRSSFRAEALWTSTLTTKSEGPYDQEKIYSGAGHGR